MKLLAVIAILVLTACSAPKPLCKDDMTVEQCRQFTTARFIQNHTAQAYGNYTAFQPLVR